MTTVKLKVARRHREGAPVRGMQGKGKRGPARTQAEIDQWRSSPPKVLVITEEKAAPIRKATSPGLRPEAMKIVRAQTGFSSKENKILQQLIQEIGEEVIDPQTGWTRIVAVIRRAYADALAGKASARDFLAERGWGKVATPIQLDVKTEIIQLLYHSLQTGLRPEQLLGDPILRKMAEDSGLVVGGELVLLPAGMNPHHVSSDIHTEGVVNVDRRPITESLPPSPDRISEETG